MWGQFCCAGQVVFSFFFFFKPGDEAEVAPLCIYSAVGGSGSRAGAERRGRVDDERAGALPASLTL